MTKPKKYPKPKKIKEAIHAPPPHQEEKKKEPVLIEGIHGRLSELPARKSTNYA